MNKILPFAEWLIELKNISSNNERIERLKEYIMINPLFKKIFYYAYEMKLNYNINKINIIKSTNKEMTEDDLDFFILILQDLDRKRFTGDRARIVLEGFICKFDKINQQMLLKIIKRDLDCGINAKTLLKIDDEWISKYSLQLAMPWNEKKLKYPCYGNIKYDGARITIDLKTLEITTRSATVLEGYVDLKKELQKLLIIFRNECPEFYNELIDYSLDGELEDINFQEGMKNLFRKNKKAYDDRNATFKIFDIVKTDVLKENKHGFYIELEQRLYILSILQKFIDRWEIKNIYLVDYVVINNKQELDSFYEKCLEKGKEGSVFKNMNSYYEFGKNYNWIKRKPVETMDMRIVEVLNGLTGKFKDVCGRLLCESEDKQIKTIVTVNINEYACYLWENRDKIIGEFVEVAFDRITQNQNGQKSVRHPRLKRLRFDK